MENVTKMLACGTLVMGSRTYTCSNGRYLHTKTLGNTCKSRACNSCGVKCTNQWIAKQQSILPDCEWQHITFTMPDILWPIFKSNRHLLEHLFRCASDVLLHWAKQKNIDVGMFSALHTFGRQLTWNTHIHLSVTRGRLCIKSGKWKPIYFNEKLENQDPDLITPAIQSVAITRGDGQSNS